jgi:GTP cyclohydrolase-4
VHTALIGIGSNLGERQGNILQALQRLRARVRIVTVSSFYETVPVGSVAGPKFLNAAAHLETDLDPVALEAAFRDVEAAIARRHEHLAARVIDIDFLYYDDLIRDFGRFELPHPYIEERPYNLIPLAEIAPEFVDPARKATLGEMASRTSHDGVVRKRRAMRFETDRQNQEPQHHLALSRVGVAKIKRIIRLTMHGRKMPLNAEFSMVADLEPDRAGVHMSRFSELLEEVLLEVLARGEPASTVEEVVERVAREIVVSQRALRADVRVRAEFGLERWTPVSGKRTEETYALVGIAHADRNGTQRAVGVEAEGMTACPCAQLMVREHSQRELVDAGFSEADANRALDALPVATHNQRGKGTVLIGSPSDRAPEIRAEDLVEIVENSMSSETYDLLKRPDEFFVVNKAHHNPRFVEDVVREILAGALSMYSDFPDQTFIAATQLNYESIHKHDAFAEAFGTFGEFRRELRDGIYVTEKTDLASWLRARPQSASAMKDALK